MRYFKFKALRVVFVFILSAVTLAACSSLHKKVSQLISGGIADHASGVVPTEAPAEYKEAIAALDAGHFDEANTKLDRFLQQNSASPWSQAAFLNSGRALEGLKRWPEAIDRYHEVVGATTQAPKLQAMALYRLSFCHEALGDDPQVVVDLTDLLSRTKSLPPEVAQGEMPARLAAAYARVGNFQQAQEFYRRAEVGVAKLRQASGSKMPDWLPRTLFLMGESSGRQVSWSDFEPAVRSFARSQIYLLEAAELDQAPWSDKAAEELNTVYKRLMQTIEGAPIPSGDPILAKRALQLRQWDRAGLLVDLVTELRARVVPSSKNSVPAPVVKIEKMLTEIDKRVALLLENRPAGEGLTDSAVARKKSGKALRALPTDDSLEQKFLRSSRESKPSPLVPAPESTPAPMMQIPTGAPAFDPALPTDLPAPIHAVPSASPEPGDPNL